MEIILPRTFLHIVLYTKRGNIITATNIGVWVRTNQYKSLFNFLNLIAHTFIFFFRRSWGASLIFCLFKFSPPKQRKPCREYESSPRKPRLQKLSNENLRTSIGSSWSISYELSYLKHQVPISFIHVEKQVESYVRKLVIFITLLTSKCHIITHSPSLTLRKEQYVEERAEIVRIQIALIVALTYAALRKIKII